MKNVRHAIITGAASGIGFATLSQWLREGNTATLVSRRPNALQEAKEKLMAMKIPAANFDLAPIDASSPNDVSALCLNLEKSGKPLDLVVNTAGQRFLGTAESTPIKDWQNCFQGNFLSAVVMNQKAMPLLRSSAKAGRQPSIVNVASVLALKPSMGLAAYASAKAALVHYTKCLALEVAADGIRVNAVAPAAVDTPLLKGDASDAEYRDLLKDMERYHPLGRIGTPEEVARAILFLGSPDNSWITGTIFSVDGGYSLR